MQRVNLSASSEAAPDAVAPNFNLPVLLMRCGSVRADRARDSTAATETGTERESDERADETQAAGITTAESGSSIPAFSPREVFRLPHTALTDDEPSLAPSQPSSAAPPAA